MRFGAVRFLYNLLFPAVFLALLPGYAARMLRRGGYREGFGQRFGIYGKRLRERLRGGGWTWIHAVSVGEVLIAVKLARRMKELVPDFRAVLSTTTSTGRALARKEVPDWMEVIYHPLDFPPFVARAFGAIRPLRLVLVEAEVWPNLVAAARAERVPVCLANARLSPRSERRFAAARPLVAPLFRALEAVCIQDLSDAARFERIGVFGEKIRLTGSIKFDREEPAGAGPGAAGCRELLDRLGVPPGAPVLLGGSTFPGEEAVLGRVARDLAAEFPDLFLIAVPRHVERAGEAVADLEAAGLAVARRTAPEGKEGCRALAVDTTGELRSWYRVATVVFVGKSLLSKGGQNPVEPIVAGKPVLFGPHMENFAPLAGQLADKGGALAVADEAALAGAVRRLLRSPEERERMAAAGLRVVDAHRGATDRTARFLLGMRRQPT